MHNPAEEKFPQQLCKHQDSPGPWLTSVAAFSRKRKGMGERRGEKGRSVSSTHTQCHVPLHDYLVHASPKGAQLLSTQFCLHPKTPHASWGAKLPFHCACSREASSHLSGKTSSWNQIGLQRAKANWNPARILVKIFWIISAHQYPSKSSSSPDTKQWAWSQTGFPAKRKMNKLLPWGKREKGVRIKSKLQEFSAHRTERQKITKHLHFPSSPVLPMTVLHHRRQHARETAGK